MIHIKKILGLSVYLLFFANCSYLEKSDFGKEIKDPVSPVEIPKIGNKFLKKCKKDSIEHSKSSSQELHNNGEDNEEGNEDSIVDHGIPIPYRGNKNYLAPVLTGFIRDLISIHEMSNNLYSPFLGMGGVELLCAKNGIKVTGSDISDTLIYVHKFLQNFSQKNKEIKNLIREKICENIDSYFSKYFVEKCDLFRGKTRGYKGKKKHYMELKELEDYNKTKNYGVHQLNIFLEQEIVNLGQVGINDDELDIIRCKIISLFMLIQKFSPYADGINNNNTHIIKSINTFKKTNKENIFEKTIEKLLDYDYPNNIELNRLCYINFLDTILGQENDSDKKETPGSIFFLDPPYENYNTGAVHLYGFNNTNNDSRNDNCNLSQICENINSILSKCSRNICLLTYNNFENVEYNLSTYIMSVIYKRFPLKPLFKKDEFLFVIWNESNEGVNSNRIYDLFKSHLEKNLNKEEDCVNAKNKLTLKKEVICNNHEFKISTRLQLINPSTYFLYSLQRKVNGQTYDYLKFRYDYLNNQLGFIFKHNAKIELKENEVILSKPEDEFKVHYIFENADLARTSFDQIENLFKHLRENTSNGNLKKKKIHAKNMQLAKKKSKNNDAKTSLLTLKKVLGSKKSNGEDSDVIKYNFSSTGFIYIFINKIFYNVNDITIKQDKDGGDNFILTAIKKGDNTTYISNFDEINFKDLIECLKHINISIKKDSDGVYYLVNNKKWFKKNINVLGESDEEYIN